MFAKLLFLAFIASPFVAQATVVAPKCSRTYVVQNGDECDGISKSNQVSTYQLAVVNQGIINPACDNLVPGRTICLGHVGEDCTTTYVVAHGDDCNRVQASSGINATLLHTNNPQINQGCSNIYIGEVLCVAKSVMVHVAPVGGPSSVVVPPSTAIPANPSATAVHHPSDDPSTHHHHHHDVHPPVHHHSSTLTTATHAPSQTPSHAPSQAPSHAPSQAPSDSNHDDDDDLPYCDEL